MILVPRPRRISAQTGAFYLSGEKRIVCEGDPTALFPIAERLQAALWQNHHIRWPIWAGGANRDPDCGAVLRLDLDSDLPAQGYRLVIRPGCIEITAAEAAGVFYGVVTAGQILRQSRGVVPACAIDDHPDFPSRGLMLDVSRDKVPTLATLFALVDQLAELKINHFELYFEAAFGYRHHRDPWGYSAPVQGRLHLGSVSGTPITGEDILRLDAYCRQRFIELVPNQNSFGHLHRWLDLPRYRHLATCPDGFDRPGRQRCEFPFSLDPTNPQSIEFLEELYDELLPHFTSRKFNVGCDETLDLGQGRSRSECDRKGKQRVYLEFLLKIHELVQRHGRTMHFWSDGVGAHPELLPDLPRDVVILEWGYGVDHPYDKKCEMYRKADRNFYVCPSTSTFGSIAGRHHRCLNSISRAAVHGHKHGAIGFLNTDWGDGGHLHYLPISYLGYTAGAAAAWCHQTYREQDLIPALDVHVFRDTSAVMGKLAYGLGNAYRHFEDNASQLFMLLWHDPAAPLHPSVNAQTLAAAQQDIASTLDLLPRARLERPDAALVRAEFANTGRFLLHACRRGTAILEGTMNRDETRRRLADEIRTIVSEHRRLWLARNRTSGLADSCQPLDDRLSELNHRG